MKIYSKTTTILAEAEPSNGQDSPTGRLTPAQRGFTLLELMIAAVILVILFMGFMSSLTSSFLADVSSNIANSSRANAERLMEESLDLSYSDCLLLDENAVLTSDGLACKIGVSQVGAGLVLQVAVVFDVTAARFAQRSRFHEMGHREQPIEHGTWVYPRPFLGEYFRDAGVVFAPHLARDTEPDLAVGYQDEAGARIARPTDA